MSQYYTMRNATLGTKHVFVGTTRMASKLQGGMSHLRAKSGKPTHPAKPPKDGGEPDPEPDPAGPGQGIYHRSESGAAHAQNTLKNPHYADPSQPLTVVQENTQIDNPAYSDWEYAFPDSYDVVSIGGGAEHLYFYHADHLGSTGYVTRADAAIVEHVQYFPFGETWIQEGKHTERYPYLFTSKELDEETGLYYFGARYYDPRTSVWQSADPILGEYLPNLLDEKQKGKDWKPERDLPGYGGVFNSRNIHVFMYSHQNPVTYIDPDGNVILYFSVGSAAAFGWKKGIGESGSGGVAFDTETMQSFTFISTGSVGDNAIAGASVGAGFSAGIFNGSIEDFKGEAKNETWDAIVGSLTFIETPNEKKGLELNLLSKGIGIGCIIMDAFTNVQNKTSIIPDLETFDPYQIAD